MIIGMVVGTFDLFHHGHARFLAECRQRCEKLIVCVLSDDLAEARKKRKPVIGASARAEVLRSIKAVDHVFVESRPSGYADIDLVELWHVFRFTFLFAHAYDVERGWVQRERLERETQARVVLLPRTDGISSASIINEAATRYFLLSRKAAEVVAVDGGPRALSLSPEQLAGVDNHLEHGSGPAWIPGVDGPTGNGTEDLERLEAHFTGKLPPESLEQLETDGMAHCSTCDGQMMRVDGKARCPACDVDSMAQANRDYEASKSGTPCRVCRQDPCVGDPGCTRSTWFSNDRLQAQLEQLKGSRVVRAGDLIDKEAARELVRRGWAINKGGTVSSLGLLYLPACAACGDPFVIPDGCKCGATPPLVEAIVAVPGIEWTCRGCGGVICVRPCPHCDGDHGALARPRTPAAVGGTGALAVRDAE